MYCSIDDVTAEIKTSNALTAADTRWLMRQLRYVSKRIGRTSKATGYDFEPRYATERFTAWDKTVDSWNNVLHLEKNLLELDSITNDGTALAYNTTVFAEPRGVTPIRMLRITPDSGLSWYSCADDPYDKVVIVGFWGWHRHYDAEGWLEVDSIQDAGGINATATTMTVVDIDGNDYYGVSPRLSAGNLVRLNDEIVEVTATNTTTNVATIIRGQRGSTAAAHIGTTPVKVWNIEDELRRACARQTAYLYARKGAFQTADFGEMGVVQYPADFVLEIKGILQELMYA